jgi:hypothetical protein
VQVDAHGDLRALHHALALLFGIRRVSAAAHRDVHVVEEQVDQALIEVGDAGVADRRQDAPQVRVAGEEGRLDQRRMCDRVGHLPAFGRVAPAVHLHGDELGGAFAVAHDGLRQLLGDLGQRAQQHGAVAGIERSDLRVACLLRGDQHEGIVGRGVAVDRDAVERSIGQLLHQRLQQRRGDHRVGGDEAQHRRHVRADHAGALRDAGDVDRPAADHDLA